jgi:hypothetical protein
MKFLHDYLFAHTILMVWKRLPSGMSESTNQ